jgi:NDP-sugar pyrophosphorylase family protein
VRVLILCGGLGTRLREETEFRPKPMVEVGGYPILWHIMKGYARHGFNDFVLLLGYKGEHIKRYFLDYRMLTSDLTVRLGGHDAVQFLARDQQLRMFAHVGSWHPMDYLHETAHLNELWDAGKAPWKTWEDGR